MSDAFNRREFLKSVSLAGASLVITQPLVAHSLLDGSDKNKIQNRHFTVSFDRKKGTFDVLRKNHNALLTAGTVAINTTSGKRTINTDFKKASTSAPFTNELGRGEKLIIHAWDLKGIVEAEIQISIFDELEIFTIELFCKNMTTDHLIIHSLEPLRAVKNEGGILHIPNVSKCITNGQMYFDTGTVHEFGTRGDAVDTNVLKGVTLANNPMGSENETIHSWWNAGFFSGYETEGVAVGYLENTACLGNLLISKNGADAVSMLAESVYAPALVLAPGKTIRSNRVMINLSENTYAALEQYADVAGKVNNARTGSIINGWSSWFYTLAEVTEDEVIANTAFAAKHLKQYGLEYIQIDEGFQKWHGDWEGNERFPHGMKWLAGRIKSFGFKAGIWISPYVVSEPAEVFQRHPDWFVKNDDGAPQRVGNWPEGSPPPENENPKRYCLDITHPKAAQWLHNLVHTIAREWGYEMIKIDFVAWSILAAKRYHNPALSSAQVYRKGMEIIRSAAGDKCHILECGPGATTVGLIDSMRIELDVNYGFTEAAWDTYFLNPASSMSAAAKRYYFHKRTWINDVDHLCTHLLNNQQAEAAATIIAMSGGNMMSGDRLTQLSSYKLEVLKKITPSLGEAAVPVDLFDSNTQSVFALKIKRPFAEWTVVAFFNASLTDAIEKEFLLERLWCKPDTSYLAFDFWRQEFIGEIRDRIKVSVQPGSVRLLTLHEMSARPCFISTDRHVSQGGVEISSVHWDADSKTLSGVSTGPLHTSHNVSLYVPGDHPWTWGGYVLFRDYGSYSLKLVHANIVQVHVRFEHSEAVKWQLDYDEFFR